MLTVNNLSFSYSKHTQLFDSINMEMEMGNIYGLLGRNGAGKSTLLKIFCGLLYPQNGSVNLYNESVGKRLPDVLANIYMLPEEFELPEISTEEYIKVFSNFYPKFDYSKLEELLREFEVQNTSSLKKLSYGQRKKFMISFAIATNCSIVYMDEPTNGLDIPSKSKFRKIVASTIDENRMYVISTHQVRDLENLIDPIVILEQGKVILNHSIELISSKLSFVKDSNGLDVNTKVFYEEPVFGGKYYLTEYVEGHDTPVDFELLFNALLANKNEIVEHLNR